MNLCSRNHSEVCFEGNDCPMCELVKEHKKELDSLESKWSDKVALLEDQLAEAEAANEA